MQLSGLMGYPLIISMLGSSLLPVTSSSHVLLHLGANLPSHLGNLATLVLAFSPSSNPSFQESRLHHCSLLSGKAACGSVQIPTLLQYFPNKSSTDHRSLCSPTFFTSFHMLCALCNVLQSQDSRQNLPPLSRSFLIDETCSQNLTQIYLPEQWPFNSLLFLSQFLILHLFLSLCKSLTRKILPQQLLAQHPKPLQLFQTLFHETQFYSAVEVVQQSSAPPPD